MTLLQTFRKGPVGFGAYMVERRRVDQPSFVDAAQRCAIVEYLTASSQRSVPRMRPKLDTKATVGRLCVLGHVELSEMGRACGGLTRTEGRTKECKSTASEPADHASWRRCASAETTGP
jgi:hypothetical protein